MNVLLWELEAARFCLAWLLYGSGHIVSVIGQEGMDRLVMWLDPNDREPWYLRWCGCWYPVYSWLLRASDAIQGPRDWNNWGPWNAPRDNW